LKAVFGVQQNSSSLDYRNKFERTASRENSLPIMFSA
jgi:hypothetical protein